MEEREKPPQENLHQKIPEQKGTFVRFPYSKPRKTDPIREFLKHADLLPEPTIPERVNRDEHSNGRPLGDKHS